MLLWPTRFNPSDPVHVENRVCEVPVASRGVLLQELELDRLRDAEAELTKALETAGKARDAAQMKTREVCCMVIAHVHMSRP